MSRNIKNPKNKPYRVDKNAVAIPIAFKSPPKLANIPIIPNGLNEL
jgi:hypothetical protein